MDEDDQSSKFVFEFGGTCETSYKFLGTPHEAQAHYLGLVSFCIYYNLGKSLYENATNEIHVILNKKIIIQFDYVLLPTSKKSDDARLARWQNHSVTRSIAGGRKITYGAVKV